MKLLSISRISGAAISRFFRHEWISGFSWNRVVLLVLIAWPAKSAVALGDARPNFLMILLDDAGWTDVGCFGSRIQTPHIDGLAAEGMSFTDCHSAAPNCSPSRAGLLTGRIPARAGIYSYIPPDHVMHLRSDEITVAEMLSDAGYDTGHFGKWHLSQLQSDQPQPSDHGFHHSLGTDNNAHPSHFNPDNFVRNGEPVGKTAGYSCQIVVDETIAWLTRTCAIESDGPFFGCVWFHEPHTPIASPPELVQKYLELYPKLTKKQATYFANIENVDRAIGRLLQGIEDLGLAKDTVIFFTSDNGPLNDFSRVGLRGKKSNVWEGGHRTPGIFRWPGRIAAGSVCSVPISGVDYLPTVCDIADLPVPSDRSIDGTSILTLLEGRFDDFRRQVPLYWFFYRLNPGMAMRDGRWTLVATTNDATRLKTHSLVRDDIPLIRSSEPVTIQLFDVAADRSQLNDLAAAHPQVVSRLTNQLRQLHNDVVTDGVQWDIPVGYGANRKRRVWNSE